MIRFVRSSKRRGQFWVEGETRFDANYDRNLGVVAVDSTRTYQTHIGFGGAFTEAAAHTVAEANLVRQAAEAYYSPKGLNYNLGRMSMHSCDFALGNYTYDTDKGFDISHEDKWVIPFVKEAQRQRGKDPIMMYMTAWSPPARMKTTNEMNHGGKLRPECRQDYAEYFVKTIVELGKRGVKIDVVNMQNEPEATQTWESCQVTAEEEADFLANYLIPALDKAKLSNVKVIIWDHNRDRMVKRAHISLASKALRDRVWGVGYHWYVSDQHKNLRTLHALYPEKKLILTECCVEYSVYDGGVGDYKNGEKYGREIINDFNNFGNGWIDWNLVLDDKGGPNHANNFCEAPIMVMGGKLIFNPSYYYIGHFSKYIMPGAVRIECGHDYDDEVYTTAYKNPDGKIVVVIQNEGWVKEIALVIDGKGLNISLPDNSITTLIV